MALITFNFYDAFNLMPVIFGLMIRSRKVMKPDRNFQMQNQFHPHNFLGIRLSLEIGRLKSRCRNIRYVLLFGIYLLETK